MADHSRLIDDEYALIGLTTASSPHMSLVWCILTFNTFSVLAYLYAVIMSELSVYICWSASQGVGVSYSTSHLRRTERQRGALEL